MSNLFNLPLIYSIDLRCTSFKLQELFSCSFRPDLFGPSDAYLLGANSCVFPRGTNKNSRITLSQPLKEVNAPLTETIQ